MPTLPKSKTVGFANTFFLSAGNHASPEQGLCAMELVAFLEGLPHSDHPRCTCQIISAFVRGINDNMPDDIRQGLLKYLPRLVGTVSEQHEQERNEYFAWQTIKVFAPAALRARKYTRMARELEASETLQEAVMIANDISEKLVARKGRFYSGANTPTPVELTVFAAARAARCADYFSKMRNDFFKGATPMTPFTSCAEAAVTAAFQVSRLGCTDAWSKAFETLEGALSIGPSGDRIYEKSKKHSSHEFIGR
jgi:hypothetical protein